MLGRLLYLQIPRERWVVVFHCSPQHGCEVLLVGHFWLDELVCWVVCLFAHPQFAVYVLRVHLLVARHSHVSLLLMAKHCVGRHLVWIQLMHALHHVCHTWKVQFRKPTLPWLIVVILCCCRVWSQLVSIQLWGCVLLVLNNCFRVQHLLLLREKFARTVFFLVNLWVLFHRYILEPVIRFWFLHRTLINLGHLKKFLLDVSSWCRSTFILNNFGRAILLVQPESFLFLVFVLDECCFYIKTWNYCIRWIFFILILSFCELRFLVNCIL